MTQQLKAQTIKAVTDCIGGNSFYSAVAEHLSCDSVSVFNSPEYIIFPGFCDVHVHFREPGFSYKETIESGSLAGAHGG